MECKDGLEIIGGDVGCDGVNSRYKVRL